MLVSIPKTNNSTSDGRMELFHTPALAFKLLAEATQPPSPFQLDQDPTSPSEDSHLEPEDAQSELLPLTLPELDPLTPKLSIPKQIKIENEIKKIDEVSPFVSHPPALFK